MLEYKLKRYGIRFVKQEESYTSQCSPLSPEVEKRYAEPSNRKERGLYRDGNRVYNADALVTQLPSNSQNFTFRFKTAGYTEYILNERSAAYDDKCKYPCSYRKDFEQLKNDK